MSETMRADPETGTEDLVAWCAVHPARAAKRITELRAALRWVKQRATDVWPPAVEGTALRDIRLTARHALDSSDADTQGVRAE